MEPVEATLAAVAPPLGDEQRDMILLDMSRRIGSIDERTANMVIDVNNHDQRIRSLEKRQWSVPGLSAIAAILAVLGIHHP